MNTTRSSAKWLRRLGSWLRRFVEETMRSPHMTNYTGFGPHGLAAGQFGAIGRGRLVLIEKRRPLAVTDASPELALEREWGWI